MSDFLDSLSDADLRKEFRKLFNRVNALEQRFISVGSLEEFKTDDMGDMRSGSFSAVVDGIVRMIMSGADLYDEYGIHANLAGFDDNSVAQIWINALLGSLDFAAGKGRLDSEAIKLFGLLYGIKHNAEDSEGNDLNGELGMYKNNGEPAFTFRCRREIDGANVMVDGNFLEGEWDDYNDASVSGFTMTFSSGEAYYQHYLSLGDGVQIDYDDCGGISPLVPVEPNVRYQVGTSLKFADYNTPAGVDSNFKLTAKLFDQKKNFLGSVDIATIGDTTDYSTENTYYDFTVDLTTAVNEDGAYYVQFLLGSRHKLYAGAGPSAYYRGWCNYVNLFQKERSYGFHLGDRAYFVGKLLQHINNRGEELGFVGAVNTLHTPYAPSLAIGSSGLVDAGVHHYAITYLDDDGETVAGATASVTLSTASRVTVTLPIGPYGTKSRKIYRTVAGADSSALKRLIEITDNTTTTYEDNIADSTIASRDAPPTVNTTLARPVMQTQAELFWDNVLTSNALTRTIDTGQSYNYYMLPSSMGSSNNGTEYRFFVWLEKGSYVLVSLGQTWSGHAKMDIYFDGMLIESGQDWYTSSQVKNVAKNTDVDILTSGWHELMYRINGQNASGNGNYYIRMTKSMLQIKD